MLSITNHAGVFLFILMLNTVACSYSEYYKQLRTGKKKEDIKITNKAKWEAIQGSIVLFCIAELLYLFIMYFFILN